MQILCSSSDFFKACLSRNWKESETLHVDLPEEDAETFDLYIQWLYTSRIDTDEGNDPTRFKQYEVLTKALVLGDKIQDVNFRDVLIDKTIELTSTPNSQGIRWNPTGKNVSRLFEYTPKGSSARQLMLDLHVTDAGLEWLGSQGGKDEDYHFEFLLELARALLVQR